MQVSKSISNHSFPEKKNEKYIFFMCIFNDFQEYLMLNIFLILISNFKNFCFFFAGFAEYFLQLIIIKYFFEINHIFTALTHLKLNQMYKINCEII